MIIKNVTISIKDGKASLSDKIILYQQDKGIEVYFTLNGLNYEFPQGGLKGVYADARLQKPSGTMVDVTNLEVTNNKIKLFIDASMTDEINEIGTHLLQIRLYDNANKINRISIPPIPFEVKKMLS